MSVLVEIVGVGSRSGLEGYIGKRGEIVEKKTDQRVNAYLVDFGEERFWFTKGNLKRLSREEAAA